MNQKGFSNFGIIMVVLTILVGAAGYFVLSKKSEVVSPENQQQFSDSTLNTMESIAVKTIISNYGFTLFIPDGWNLWEGQSAVLNLMEKEGDNFVSSYEAGWTQKQINEYQNFMDSWVPETAKMLVFTNVNVDYKNRSFADAGKIISTLVDSESMIKLEATQLIVSDSEVNLSKEVVSNDELEVKYINIDGKKSLLQIGKKFKIVELIIIQIPFGTDKYIDGEKIKSITFLKYVEKNDPKALSELTSFISEMNITQNP